LREGELPFFLYYLLDGRAKLFLTHENGRVSLVDFLNAPCFIGEMELLEAKKAARGVTALTPCICYAVPIDQCRERLLKDAGFLLRLCRFLSRKADGNTERYSRNQAYPLKARLADFILLTSQNGFYREKHTEASEFLGVTYRYFLFVLEGFVKDGLLKKTKQGYRIENPERLRGLAGGEG